MPFSFKLYYQEHKEAIKAAVRANYQAHRATKLACAKQYRESHREAVAATKAAWTKRNRRYLNEKRRSDPRTKIWGRIAKIKRGDARKKGFVDPKDWQGLCEEFKFACAYCHEVRPLEMDHVVPLSRGGTHEIGNLLPACRSCNSQKHIKSLEKWKPAYAEYMAQFT